MDQLGFSGAGNKRANLDGHWIVIYFYPGAQNAEVLVENGTVKIPNAGKWYEFGKVVAGPAAAHFIWGFDDKTGIGKTATKQTAIDFQPNKINWVSTNEDKVKYGSMMWKRAPQ